MKNTLTFRLAAKDDIPAMSRIRLAVTENTLSDPTRITTRMYEDYLETLGRGWVAESVGQIVGFAYACRVDGSVWALFVQPGQEGRGAARGLMKLLTAWLFSIGHERVQLGTEAGTRADRFYQAQGWKRGEMIDDCEVAYTLDRKTWLGMQILAADPASQSQKPHQIFIALDFDNSHDALALVKALGPEACAYKVGLQLLTEAGPDLVRRLVAMGKDVFLDLKLHEIPNSVAAAVAAAGRLGVSMVTVHASAGSAVLRSAVEAARPYPQLRVLALTVITSLRDQDLPEIGLAPSIQAQVERLALLACAQGCHGIVASAQEAARLRALLPISALIVTPGIQLPESGATDQARMATPAAAARAGASHIVIGRAITQASDPLAALLQAREGFTSQAGGQTEPGSPSV